jgi:hypothetical protein
MVTNIVTMLTAYTFGVKVGCLDRRCLSQSWQPMPVEIP